MKPITEIQIKQLLLDDGIHSNLVGFEYLAIAINQYENGATRLKTIFDEISNTKGVSFGSVVNGIRNATLKSQLLLSKSKKSQTIKPTTASYIAYCKLQLIIQNSKEEKENIDYDNNKRNANGKWN